MSKALLIKSYATLTTGTQGTWNDLNQASSYIQGIQTGEILEDVDAEKIASLISGVPTPWARARLFSFALTTLATPDPNISNSGLTQFYEMLHGEWRGLFALLALYPDRIRFSKPVTMNRKGEDYDIASAFGRMLFEDCDLWSDQGALAKDQDAQPYIHLIYYKNQLIGGTSPLTGVFTGVNYSNLKGMDDVNWFRNGKLEDPTYGLTREQAQKLYLFIKNMNGNLGEFENKVNSQRVGDKAETVVELKGFKEMSRQWESELKGKFRDLRDKGPVSTFGSLQCPFSVLWKNEVPVYLKNDNTFTFNEVEDSVRISDIQSLLSDDHYVIGWAEGPEQRQKRSDAPVYFLQVKDIKSGSVIYFTVPLSELGVTIFQNNLSNLLGYTAGGRSHMSASVSANGETLSVSMVVEIDGEDVALNTKEYNIDWMEDMGHVIMWPNFVSTKWNKYYLYSEFTSVNKNRFVPIFADEGKVVKDGNKAFLTPDYVKAPSEAVAVKLDPLVKYPSGLGDEFPKYDIISSDKPIEGLISTVKKNGKEERAGFLMVRHDVVKNLSGEMKLDAVVGIDFGSNNTCVYYHIDGRDAVPIQFENNRSVLVGCENDDKRANAGNDELLFFTNYPADNGQLKSWLHEHDALYVGPRGADEVAGGVPVNRPNVSVREMTEYEIKTQAGTLRYNMKWLDDDKGLDKKRAFIKSIWLQACASLFKNKIRPAAIRWSYPGSMMKADINGYSRIFEALDGINPIHVQGGSKLSIKDSVTEAEAVCSYALSQNFGRPTERIMFLGIDVGGSTSDILLIGQDPKNGRKQTLFRESSVRLAAGVFFDAVIKSETFRRALVDFHESNQRSVYVSNIKEILTEPKKAPYYLNNIFDQLKTPEDYDLFYDSIYREAKFVFTIPAYVTGLLLFYSGMLVAKTIKEYGLDGIERVDLLSFGKGGRLFHWLRQVGMSATKEYYTACLNAGAKCVSNIELTVKYRDEIEVDNKAEVAKGLSDYNDVEKKQENNDSDICGEKGVMFGDSRDVLDVDAELNGVCFAGEMSKFSIPEVKNFEAFMDIFINFVSQETNLYKNAEVDLRDDLADLPSQITNFFTRDREYVKARKNAHGDESKFNYHQPLIIAEGVCFLNTLIRKAFNQ